MTHSDLAEELKRTHAEITELLAAMGPRPDQRDYLEFRAQIGRLQARFDDVNNSLSARLGLTSAKARLLAYLELHVGEVVTKEALSGVAGIFEFQRRLRELRQDEGYDLSSMETHANLRPGEYILLSSRRAGVLNDDWELALANRRRDMRGPEALLALLRAIAPRSAAPALVALVLDGASVDSALGEIRRLGWIVSVDGSSGDLRLDLRSQ